MSIVIGNNTFNNGGTARYVLNGSTTNLTEIKYRVGTGTATTVWKKETNLWVNGATSESGAWSSVKNSLDRGQTIAFGTTIGTTANTNSNSSHGVLIYPANKISVTRGDTISLDVSRHHERCPDSNVTTWTFYISILYLTEVPSDFGSTFDINSWVSNKTYKHTVQSTSKGGSSGTQTIRAKTFTGTVPNTGNYYVCICIHGYDSNTYDLTMNNFKIV